MSLTLAPCCYQELRTASRALIDLYESVAETGAGVAVPGCFSFMRVTSLMLYDKLCVMSRVTPNCSTVHLPADRSIA